MNKKCYKCKKKPYKKLGLPGIKEGIFICEKCADKLLVAAILCDCLKNKGRKNK